MEEKIFYTLLKPPLISARDSMDMAYLLGKVLHEENSCDFTLERLRLSAKMHNTYAARLHDSRGRIIGTARTVMNYSAMDTGVWLEDVALRPTFEGRGIMTALLKKVIETEKQRGATYMSLTSRDHRIRAIKLYEKLGFKKVHTNVFELEF